MQFFEILWFGVLNKFWKFFIFFSIFDHPDPGWCLYFFNLLVPLEYRLEFIYYNYFNKYFFIFRPMVQGIRPREASDRLTVFQARFDELNRKFETYTGIIKFDLNR